MPIPEAVIEMPLPFSVRRLAIEPTMVTSSPSRIQTVPRPITTIQWKRDHGSRSRRFGMSVSMMFGSAEAAALLMQTANPHACDRKTPATVGTVLACRVLGHRYRFRAEGETMTWECERGCGAGGSKRYETAAEATRYANAFDREDRHDLG